MSEMTAPLHMQYPGKWQLGPSGPDAVKDYLAWTLGDSDRTESAAWALRRLGIGMHFLTIAQKLNALQEVEKKIELNFWSEEFPAEVGAGGHAHARDMELWSYIHPNARQQITGIALLPPSTRKLPDLPVEKRKLVMLNKVDTGDGLGTFYHPVVLGERLTLEGVTDMPPGTHQRYSSLFIHEVGYEGPGMGVTVQRQGHTEQDALNSFEGFTTYKGLTPAEAEEVIRQRRTQTLGDRVVASTVLVRDLDFTVDQLEDRAYEVEPERYAYLAEGAIRSLEILIRRGMA